jgi:tetratricopeptide (TPR) repeat protein
MPKKIERRATLEELPRVSQTLRLTCCQCRKRAVYDVGTIFYEQEGEGESAIRHYTFSNYFRCRTCGSAGPWEIAGFVKMLGLALRARVDRSFTGLLEGRCALFDGTFIQTPAMGEDHLRKLIEKEPRNAFLCTRLANLFRGCGETSEAVEWYEQALRLDPGDVEARYHLFCFAEQNGDTQAFSVHGPLLVRYLLEGRKTNKDDLTDALAVSVVERLRDTPESFQKRFLGQPGEMSSRKEDIFIRTLLEQEGDEDTIVTEAAERLLDGQSAPSVSPQTAPVSEGSDSPAIDLIPSLKHLVDAEGLDARKLTVPLQADNHQNIKVQNRHSVPVFDRKKLAFWPVPSLRALFRGNRTPPSDIDHYPPEYSPHFFFIEHHVLTLCKAKGDRTDQELEQIYSTVRRRPDGRSLGEEHDFLWQVTALALGMYALSEAEFDAVLGQLARSARNWAQAPVSRNYVVYLRKSFRELG